MRILVIGVTRNRKGQPVRAERAVEGETIRVGRGTQCEIHLPDPRVVQLHASIDQQGDSVVINAADGEMLADGVLAREARFTPGVHVAVGPYDLTVESAPEGYDVALAIELVRPLPDDLAGIRANSRLSLAVTGLSKRAPAWALAIFIALAFLALPITNTLVPSLREVISALPVTPDQSWNPGELAAGHQIIGRKCSTCHEIPFVRVRDSACVGCHQKTLGHVQTVALQQDLFGDTRCANCHADHKGPHALSRGDPDLCATCHGDLKHRKPDTVLANATDFGSDHPGFKLTLLQGPAKDDTARIAQTDAARLFERSHLKFPHDTHLRTNLRAPKGRKTLECRSCHLPDASGKSFEPISMRKVCVECHLLEFEPAVTKRQVPHGSVDDAVTTLREFYSYIILNDVPVDVIDVGAIRSGLPRLGGGAVNEEQRQRALNWANAKTRQVAEDLFEARVCIVCHFVDRTVTRLKAGRERGWSVTQVSIATTWLPKARFDHLKHRTYKCGDCHHVEKSHSSADIAIPDIVTCRQCHTGTEPAANKVVSTCIACHGFHLPGHPPFGQQSSAGIARPAGASGAIAGGSPQ